MVYAIRLDKPTSEQIDRIVEILFEAFHDDDIILGLSGYSDEAFREELYWQIDAQNTTYETWVAVDDDEVTTPGESRSGGSALETIRGKIVGAGLVVPPGKAYATRPQRIDDLVNPDVLEWQKTKFFHQVQALDTASFGPEGVKPYRHLMLLGISSSCRGKGAGTILVKRLIEEAASEGVKLSLNCEDMRVAELYKRLGFAVTAGSTFALRHKDKYATGMVNECK